MSTTARRIMLAGGLLCVLWVIYFVMADQGFIHTGRMAPIFRFLLLAADGKSVWLGLIICLLALAWSRAAPLLALVDALGCHERITAIVCALLLCAGTVLVYYNHPFSMDEYAALFQARIFAGGHVSAHLPAQLVDWLVVPGFNGVFILASHTSGAAIESYWPGFALLLAPFVLLGTPWLCNALLAGLALYLIHRMTLEITQSQRAAGWSLLFALGSGAFIANAISYYSMQAHLTANLLFAWLLFQPSARRCFAAGLVGSLALVLHNPFPHAMFAAPWVIALALDRGHRRFLWLLVLGYLPLTAVVGVGWLVLRAHVLPTVAHVSTASGFLSGIFAAPDALMLSTRIACTAKLWVWAVPCLLIFAAVGAKQCWAERRVRLLALSALVTYGGYLVVTFDQGHGWGYRYFHSAWGVIPILGACAMARLQAADRLNAFAGACAFLSLLLLVPLQLWQIHGVMGAQLSQIEPALRPGSNVYFIEPASGFYTSDLVQFDPLLRDQDLMLVSRGELADAELIQQNYPQAERVSHTLLATQWRLSDRDERRPSSEEPTPHLRFDRIPTAASP